MTWSAGRAARAWPNTCRACAATSPSISSIVNAENAAGGFGITEATARELFDSGADCLTLGNHSWDQKEALTYIVREPRLIRPLNYPRMANGRRDAGRSCSTDAARACASW